MQDIAYVLATGYVGLSILLSGVFVRPSSALAVLHLISKVNPQLASCCIGLAILLYTLCGRAVSLNFQRLGLAAAQTTLTGAA